MMSQLRTLNLGFPSGGLNRKLGRQFQLPSTTPDCLNVRPESTGDGRFRGGSRPGISKAFSTLLSVSTYPQNINSLRAIDTVRGFRDSFVYAGITYPWSILAGSATPGSFVGYKTSGGANDCAMRVTYLTDADWGAEVTLELDNYSVGANLEHYLIGHLADNTGNRAVIGRIKFGPLYNLGANNFTVTIEEVVGGINTTVATVGLVDPVTDFTTLKMKLNGTKAEVWWRGSSVLSYSSFSYNPAVGYVGIGLKGAGVGSAAASEFRISYTAQDSGVRTMVQAGDSLYRGDDVPGELKLVPYGGFNSSSSQQYTSIARLGKLYMIRPLDKKVYDLATDYFEDWIPTYGSIPLGTTMCLYQDRIVIAYENIWAMSRQSDPLDWDTGASDLDPGRAIDGTTADTGTVGQHITALIAGTGDFLFIACRESLWIMLGNPAAGGVLLPCSATVGVIGPHAWCKTPEDNIYFLSDDGLYVVSAGQRLPLPVSRDSLPRELLDLSPDNLPTLCYDFFARGVHIYVNTGTIKSWFYHIPTGSYWPVELPWDVSVTHSAISDQWSGSRVLLGCSDHYIRRFDETMETDDGTALNSYVVIGPFSVNPSPLENGKLLEMDAILSENSGDVTWEAQAGNTHYEALQAAVRKSGTFQAGRNPTRQVQLRGPSMALKLSSSEQWSMEGIGAVAESFGRIRL